LRTESKDISRDSPEKRPDQVAMGRELEGKVKEALASCRMTRGQPSFSERLKGSRTKRWPKPWLLDGNGDVAACTMAEKSCSSCSGDTLRREARHERSLLLDFEATGKVF